jgi:hypothetical protein
MGYRAKHAFISYAGGTRQLFKRGDVVPDEVAAKVLAFTDHDGASDEPTAETKPPKKRATKRADKSDG